MTLVSRMTLIFYLARVLHIFFYLVRDTIDRNIPKYILWYMNTNTTILIKTDKKVKAAAQRAAKDVGVPLATILNAYLRQFARERRIEFEASLIPNARTRKIIDEARREYAAGKSYGPFKTVEQLFESLEE